MQVNWQSIANVILVVASLRTPGVVTDRIDLQLQFLRHRPQIVGEGICEGWRGSRIHAGVARDFERALQMKCVRRQRDPHLGIQRREPDRLLLRLACHFHRATYGVRCDATSPVLADRPKTPGIALLVEGQGKSEGLAKRVAGQAPLPDGRLLDDAPCAAVDRKTLMHRELAYSRTGPTADLVVPMKI